MITVSVRESYVKSPFSFGLGEKRSEVKTVKPSNRRGYAEVAKESNPNTAFIEDIVKEVGRLPYRKRQVFEKTLVQASTLVLSFTTVAMAQSTKASASGIDQIVPFLQQRNSTVPTTATPNQGETIPVDGNMVNQLKDMGILPPDVLNILVDIIVTCGILGVLLAIVCLMVAGGFRMLGQLERARKWSVDVIKGLGQILLAPVIIILLTLLTSMLLGSIEGLDVFY